MLFAFAGMWRFGIAASLLSLGALDFGLVVDSSVVMVENCVRHIAHGDHRAGPGPSVEVVRDAAVEVRRPTLFGELIIMIVYLPILTLGGGRGETVGAVGPEPVVLGTGRLDDPVDDPDARAGKLSACRGRTRSTASRLACAAIASGIYAPVLRLAELSSCAVLATRGGGCCGWLRHYRADTLGPNSCRSLSEGHRDQHRPQPRAPILTESVRSTHPEWKDAAGSRSRGDRMSELEPAWPKWPPIRWAPNFDRHVRAR